MFKKRVIILFFTLFLFNLNGDDSEKISDKKYIEDLYNKDTKVFFTQGILEVDDNSFEFSLFKEKNKYAYYNYSLMINENIYKVVSRKYSTSYYFNDKEIEHDYIIKEINIPINIFNYSLINRNYVLLSKSGNTKHKNIPVSKLLIKEKVVDPLENIEEEVIESEVETVVDESITDSAEDIKKDVTNDTEQSVILNSDSIVYEEALYPKVIYHIAKDIDLALKLEFYLDIDSKTAAYSLEADNVSFINNKYFVTEYNIYDNKQNSVSFKYNIESIILEKKIIDKKFNNMIFFNGDV